MFGRVQHVLRQNQAVSRHHHNVRANFAQQGERVGIATQFFRLRHAQAQRLRGLFYGRCLQLHTASFRAIGLS